ncbi:MAG: tetratricopeptide repeat protein [Actinomycetota bacterium]|nr:tetratricopeptide repeat protein [Actinomycetota bacterium]
MPNPTVRRGERPLQVFISSVIAGLEDERRHVAQVVRDAGMHAWLFEETPPHSGGLETSYLEQVSESEFVIWLEAGVTTEPVEREIRTALRSAKTRLLVFRLPADERDERTRRLIEEVRRAVKYSEVDQDGLTGAVRAALDDELARAVRAPAAPHRFMLPPSTTVRGRERALDEIAAALNAGEAVAISGLPGVGKTATAIAAARAATVDDVLFVALRGTTNQPADAHDLLRELLEVAGVAASDVPEDEASRSQLWRSVSAQRGFTVVYDDARDEAHVRPFLETSGGNAIVTSRATLLGLAARLCRLDVLDPDGAREMLQDSVGDGRVRADPDGARRLVELCGHLPLAVRIAGRRLASRPAWSVDHLAGELCDERERLSGLEAGELAIRAAFNLSYAQLDDLEAATFRRLGLFRSGSLRAEAMAPALGSDAGGPLERLTDLGLLDTDTFRSYRVHDLLRIYAFELFGDEPGATRVEALRRLAQFYAAEAADRSRQVQEPGGDYTGYREALRWFDAEWPSILGVVDALSQEKLDDELDELSDSVAPLASRRRRWREWEELLRKAAEAAARRTDDDAERRARQNLGIALLEQGSMDAAVEELERSLRLAELAEDVNAQARALAQLGSASKRAGQPGDAVERLQRAAALYRKSGDDLGAARALGDLGNALEDAGDVSGAIAAHEAALESFSKTGAAHEQALEHGNLGVALAAAGEFGAAARAARAAAGIFSELDDDRLRAKAQLQLAQYLIRDGDARGAATVAGEAADASRRVEDPLGEANAIAWRARAHAEADDLDAAVRDHRAVREILKIHGAVADRALHLAEFAELLFALGDVAEARSLFEDALVATGDVPPRLRANIVVRLAQIDEREGEPTAGERRLVDAIRAAQDRGDRDEAAVIQLGLAHAHHAWGERADADAALRVAVGLGISDEEKLEPGTDVHVSGADQIGDRRRLGRIVLAAIEELGLDVPQLEVAVEDASASSGGDWRITDAGIGLQRWLIGSPDPRSWLRLAATVQGALAARYLLQSGVDGSTPFGQMLIDLATSWVIQHSFVVHGDAPEDSPVLPQLTDASFGPDVVRVLGAALAGNRLAGTRLAAWRAQAGNDESKMVEALWSSLHGAREPLALLQAVVSLFESAAASSS